MAPVRLLKSMATQRASMCTTAGRTRRMTCTRGVLRGSYSGLRRPGLTASCPRTAGRAAARSSMGVANRVARAIIGNPPVTLSGRVGWRATLPAYARLLAL